MKNSKVFQYVVIGAFVFFILVGAILFSTYKPAEDPSNASISIKMWGTLPAEIFIPFTNQYFSDKKLKYTIDYIEKNSATFDQNLVEALASGNGPDAIFLPSDLIIRYSNKVFTIPFTLLPELSFKQTYIQESELYLNNQGVRALPFSVDPLVMYWNREIFNGAGITKPPVTWAEISSLVPKITKKDQANNITRSAVALGEFRNISNAKEIYSSLLIQAGSSIVKQNSDGTYGSDMEGNSDTQISPAALALEYYTNFSNPIKNEYSWNRSLSNSLDVFANGDLAIYFGFASEYAKIKYINPNLNFGVALLPQATGAKTLSTFGNMLGMAIMKDSSDPAGTYSVLSALTSAAAFPYWKDVLNVPSARRDILGQTETNDIKTIFNQSAIISKGWLDPNETSTSAIFQEMIESYTTSRGSIEQVVSLASDKLNSLLGNNQ